MYISIELVQKIVKDLKEDLMRDAIRTIRQRKPEAGMACIAEIDGVDKLSGAISQACVSAHYRENGHVVLSFPVEAEAPPPSPKRRKPGFKVTELPEPAAVVRKRSKVRPIRPVAAGE